jgi:hypothetical protein
VSTPSDFGLRSEPPSHPELLDWLARRFVADGWSVKKLHRLIMSSYVYQQGSGFGVQGSGVRDRELEVSQGMREGAQGRGRESAMRDPQLVDPGNRLLWRMNPRRLDFEAMWDSLLAVSGQLDLRMGGRPDAVLEYSPSGRRRAVYRFTDRLNVPNLFRTFDVASPDTHSPERHLTTVPQQALFLMNSTFMAEQARSLAGRLQALAAERKEERIEWLYRLLFGRSPSLRERELGCQLADAPLAEPVVTKPRAWFYGYGQYDRDTQRLENFRALDHFSGVSWQGGSSLPDPETGRLSLTASGGHAGIDQRHAAVRRWVAPTDGTVEITGKLVHKEEVGDGIRAYIVAAGTELAAWSVRRMEVETSLKGLTVKQGDTLDFVVECRGDAAGDEFLWAPVIRRTANANASKDPDTTAEWNAAKDFAGPPAVPLTPWEKYVQVLLLSNEFVFVD